MATVRVKIHNEVSSGKSGNWRLCFQKCTYNYSDGRPSEDGYRFIWRRPNNNLQAARGQARIPNLSELDNLIADAKVAGWLLK
jgi:hypothetical protein